MMSKSRFVMIAAVPRMIVTVPTTIALVFIGVYGARALYIEHQTEAHIERGDAKYDKGDFDGAIADLTSAINLDPSSGEAYYDRPMRNSAKEH